MRWRSQKHANKPTISIIIAARNECRHLDELLPKLQQQQYPTFEIILVLDRCTDASHELVGKHANEKLKCITISQVPSGWDGKKYALDQGIKKASNEWLVFTDADCRPNSELWLSTLAKEMSGDTDIVLGVSPYKSENQWPGYYIQFEAFITYWLYTSLALLKVPYMCVGRNMAIRRLYFESLGGYQSIKSINGGDDDLFIQKATSGTRIKVALGKDALVTTFPKPSWRRYFRQKLRHFSVSQHYKTTHVLLLSVFHASHLLSIVFLGMTYSTDYFLGVLLFYLFIKFVSYRFAANKIGAGFNYILLPLVDIGYAMLTPVLGIASKLVKDIKWKN
ncbi:MAG: glycosyltransferase [Ekhidna sp.]